MPKAWFALDLVGDGLQKLLGPGLICSLHSRGRGGVVRKGSGHSGYRSAEDRSAWLQSRRLSTAPGQPTIGSDPPASASWVFGLHMCAIKPHLNI